jgi:hypothetical protein
MDMIVALWANMGGFKEDAIETRLDAKNYEFVRRGTFLD